MHEGKYRCPDGCQRRVKTTTLKAISNLLRAERGDVTKGSIEVSRWQGCHDTRWFAKRGVIQVMEGRHCFGHLTVEENLLTGAYKFVRLAVPKNDLERIYQLLPRLKPVAIQVPVIPLVVNSKCAVGRAMMARPTMILLDEPSMVWHRKREEIEIRRAPTVQVSFVGLQNTMIALALLDYGYIIENGRVVMGWASERVNDNEDVEEFHLGLAKKVVRAPRSQHYRRRKRWLA